MDAPRARTSRRDRGRVVIGDRIYRRGMLACVLLATGIFGVAAGDLALVLGTWIIAGALWHMTEGGRGSAWPRPIVNILLLAVALYAARGVLDGGLGVDEFAELVAGLLLVKLVDRRGPRDDAQLLTLAAFLAVGAVLTSNELLIGLGLVLFVPTLLATAVRFQLHAARYEAASEDRARVTNSKTKFDPEPVRLGGVIASLAFASGVVGVSIFLLFPRGLGQETFGPWGNAAIGRQAGFAPEVNLGMGGLISTVQTPVIDLRILDEHGRTLGSDREIQYLRGAVLDVYRDGRWARAGGRYVEEDRPRTIPAGEWVRVPGADAGPRTRRALITLRDAPDRRAHHLFTLHETVGVRFDTRERAIISPRDAQVIRSGAGGQLSYEVQYRPAPEGLPFVDRARERAPIGRIEPLVLAEANLALRARDIEPDPAFRDPSEDVLALRAIEVYLREQFTYTLDTLAAPPGRDPVEWFLTEARTGHCEYFASAMALMCRAVGIEARVVTGYVAFEFNAQTGTYTVRSSNAHAWVEAEARPGQWRTYDPTPPSELMAAHAPEPTAARLIRRWLDAVEYAWIRSIVGYQGPGERRETLSRPSEASPGSEATEGDPARAWSQAFQRVLWLIAGSAALAWGLWILLRARPGGSRERLPSELRFYERALRALRRHGLAKPDARPPRDHAESLRADHPRVAEAFGAIAELFYRARFGRVYLTPADRARAAELVERLTAELAARPRRGASENLPA